MSERIEEGSLRPRPSWKRRLELALWVTGIVTLGAVAWGWLDARLYQARQERLLEQALVDAAREPGRAPIERSAAAGATSEAEAPPRVVDEAPAETDRPQADEPPARPSARATARARRIEEPAGDLLARLSVPRLDMSVMVAPGLESRTLRRAAGHIPGTAPVGSAGNVGLAGHRDSFFRPLRDVRVGDEIVLTTPESISTYRVEWAEVVSREATEVLRPTGYAALTLVTCYPFTYVGTAPDRLVVRARLVESRAPSAPERVAALTGR